MAAGRDPVDRVLDVLVSAPLCTAIAARDAVPVLARAVRLGLGSVTRALLVEEDRVARHDPGVGTSANDEAVDAGGPVVEAQEDEVSSVAPAAGASLPIDGYDHLAARQVVDRLPGLTPVELELVAAHERSHRHRRTVLGKIDQLLGS